MSATLDLVVETRLEEMERLAVAVEGLGEKEDWPLALTFQVNLVLEELWLNVLNHGHDDGCHEVLIRLVSEDESLTIEISDDGKPFDPLEDAPIPDTVGELGDRKIGGLGIHLVRTMMDELEYKREEGKNHLILVKRRDE